MAMSKELREKAAQMMAKVDGEIRLQRIRKDYENMECSDACAHQMLDQLLEEGIKEVQRQENAKVEKKQDDMTDELRQKEQETPTRPLLVPPSRAPPGALPLFAGKDSRPTASH